MPDIIQHRMFTEMVLDLLTPYFKLPNKEHRALVEEYCLYPDDFFSMDEATYKNISPYIFIKDEIPFHYLPDTPLNDLYRFWLPNLEKQRLEKTKIFHNDNFCFAKEGFEFYLNNIVECFKNKNYREGAIFAGCLIHMLEDASFGVHSLEGPYGTDIFILDRLFEEPDDLRKKPLNILASIDCSKVLAIKHDPQLIGASVPEIAMRLYAVYTKAVITSRRLCFKIVNNVYQNKENENQELIQKMIANVVKLCTDMLFSVFSVADQNFKAPDGLKKVFLSELEPFVFPLGGGVSGGYRFLSYLKDIAVNNKLEKITLQLKLDEKIVTFSNGLSMGSNFDDSLCYWIPESVYSVFDACIGLHPSLLNRTAGVKVQLINDGEIVKELNFDENHSAVRVTLQYPRGKFGFKISYIPNYIHQSNIIVIGNPILQK